MEQARILCVDDEPFVLSGLTFHLRRHFQMHCATSGAQGLELMRQEGPFAVVLSDMRMPGMDGAAFLAKAREAAPDTVRMLLTGQADMQSAIAAVNEGQIFRFLTKPCAPELLQASLAEAVRQHRLVTAEKVLLEQTLRGSVRTLTEVLSLSNPTAFGRALRLWSSASAVAKDLGLREVWRLEVATMLSQLGLIILPAETLERHLEGRQLSGQEQAMVARVPVVTEELLAHIPRLEEVRELVAQCHGQAAAPGAAAGDPGELRLAGQVLRAVADCDELESGGLSTQSALDTLRGRANTYEPRVLESLTRARKLSSQAVVREIPARALAAGMVLVDDVRTLKGVLIMSRGHVLSASSVERLRNFEPGSIREPLRVLEGPPQATG